MTDEDIIKVCAEANGRTACYSFRGYLKQPCMRCGHSADSHREDDDFLEDWNAIIPLIQKLDSAQFMKFICELLPKEEVFGELHTMNKARAIYFATPRQLATALVKALGKWKE